MGEGRAVEGRQANPSVCLATPPLTDSLKAFLRKNSSRVIAFLPGSAQNVENDVTSTKQTAGEFLPGATTSQCRAQISIAKPLSNRELGLLEPRLTRRQQTIGPRSNRELSTNPCFCNSDLRRPFTSHSLALTQEGPLTTSYSSFLTGSGSQTEFAVTHSKQMTASFLTGSRIDTLAFHSLHDSVAQAAPAGRRNSEESKSGCPG